MQIDIIVNNKVAMLGGSEPIVCGNSDYTVNFQFDSEWNAFYTKTARFTYKINGKRIYLDVVFSGNTCNMPIFRDITEVEIGVFAGDLHTTTPAKVLCRKSILCDEGVEGNEPTPVPDVYTQVLERLNDVEEIIDYAEEMGERAEDASAGVITIEQNKQTPLQFWVGSRLEYDALTEKSANVFYIIEDEVNAIICSEELQALSISYPESVSLDKLKHYSVVRISSHNILCNVTKDAVNGSYYINGSGLIETTEFGDLAMVYVRLKVYGTSEALRAVINYSRMFRLNAPNYVTNIAVSGIVGVLPGVPDYHFGSLNIKPILTILSADDMEHCHGDGAEFALVLKDGTLIQGEDALGQTFEGYEFTFCAKSDGVLNAPNTFMTIRYYLNSNPSNVMILGGKSMQGGDQFTLLLAEDATICSVELLV